MIQDLGLLHVIQTYNLRLCLKIWNKTKTKYVSG